MLHHLAYLATNWLEIFDKTKEFGNFKIFKVALNKNDSLSGTMSESVKV